MFISLVRRYLNALPAEQTGWLAGLRDRHVGQALNLLDGGRPIPGRSTHWRRTSACRVRRLRNVLRILSASRRSSIWRSGASRSRPECWRRDPTTWPASLRQSDMNQRPPSTARSRSLSARLPAPGARTGCRSSRERRNSRASPGRRRLIADERLPCFPRLPRKRPFMQEVFMTEFSHLSKSQRAELQEDISSNPSDNPTIGDIIAARFNRRDWCAAASPSPRSPRPSARWRSLPPRRGRRRDLVRFQGARGGIDDKSHVAEGYDADMLMRWGDPVAAGRAGLRPERSRRAGRPGKQFGYNNDYVGYHPDRRRPSTARPAGRQPRIHQRGADVPRLTGRQD